LQAILKICYEKEHEKSYEKEHEKSYEKEHEKRIKGKIGYEKDLHFDGGMPSEHRRKGSKSER